jgi:hypothetical protein
MTMSELYVACGSILNKEQIDTAIERMQDNRMVAVGNDKRVRLV